MNDEKKTVILKQDEGERLALDHDGGVALYGNEQQPALRHEHQVAGQVVHGTSPQHPLVHMVCWEEEQICKVEVEGRVTLVGDKEAPVHVRVAHEFTNSHVQEHQVAPLEHSVQIETRLSDPVHHALQMRTPLQHRFCNPWHIASDYVLQITVGDTELGSIRLTGATIATPQPCEDDSCPPPSNHASYP